MSVSRQGIQIGVLLAALLALLGWSYTTLRAARVENERATIEAATAERLASEIEILSAKPQRARLSEVDPITLTARIAGAAKKTGIAEKNLIRIDPEAAQRMGTGPYLLRGVRVELRRVELAPLLRFVTALTGGDDGLRLAALRLAAPRAKSSGKNGKPRSHSHTSSTTQNQKAPKGTAKYMHHETRTCLCPILALACLALAGTGCASTGDPASPSYDTVVADPQRDTDAARRLHEEALGLIEAGKADEAKDVLKRAAPAAGTGSLANRAQDHYTRAIRAQRNGDWAQYGAELERLGAVLEELRAGESEN